ncbi:MAG: transporter substrate-binding domain-containing protein [Treponema sp.]|nr:transporter substrate-binding domain-containing protein [Treponema sp.]
MTTIFKQITKTLILVCFVICFFNCSVRFKPPLPPLAQPLIIDTFKSYRDIPGVTAQEINAIEALKASRTEFIYGSMPSTEAFMLAESLTAELKDIASYEFNAGYAVMFSNLLSELFDIPFILQSYGWTDLKDGIDNNTIDFTGDMTPTPERRLVYYMSYPIAERGLGVFTRDDLPNITLYELKDRKIGFYKGTITAESVFSAYPELNFEIVDVFDDQDVYEKLSSGIIDVFIVDATEALIYSRDFVSHKNIFPLIYTPVSLTTANPELAPVISVVNKYIQAGGIDKLYELYIKGNQDYAKYEFIKSLTGTEREYLDNLSANNTKVNISIESDNYPICFYNENENKFQGIAVDVLSEVTLLTGIEFENVSKPNEPWIQIFDKLISGETSMVTELLFSDERKDRFLWPEMPYAVSRYALISKSDYPYLETYQVVRSSVGVMTMTGREDVYRTLFPNNDNLKRYDFQSEAFDALERGEVDLVMSTEYDFLTLTNYLEKPGYKLNIVFNSPLVESFFGFNINEEILCSIISKSLNHIDTKRIESDWVNRAFNYESIMAYERLYYANQRSVILAIASAIMLLFLITLIILLVNNNRIQKLYKNEMITLSAVFNSLPYIAFCKDEYGKYTKYNHGFEKFTGLGKNEIIGKTIEDVFSNNENIIRIGIDTDKKFFSKTTLVKTEETVLFNDGSNRIFELIKTPLINDDKIIGLLGIMRDVTEKTAANERQMLMLDTSPLCTQIWDKNINTIDCNEEAVKLYGFKDKKEYIERFTNSCSPEYQLDGQRSDEKASKLVNRAFKEGYCKFNWMHKMPDDSTPIPAEVTLVRSKYADNDVVIGYTRDLREYNVMMKEIEYRDNLMRALNQAAVILLNSAIESFEDDLFKSMMIMGEAVKASSLYIWENHIINGELCCSLLYQWYDDSNVQNDNKHFKNISYNTLLPGWEEFLLENNKCLNGPLRDMSPAIQALFSLNGVLSLLITPIFIKDQFWGFVGFDNCHAEKVFNKEEIRVLRSLGILFANAVLRNQLVHKIQDDTIKLETALDETQEATKLKDNALIAMENILNSIEAGIYVTVPETGELLFVNTYLRKAFNIVGDVTGNYCYKVFRKDRKGKCDFCPCYQLENEPDSVIVWEEHSKSGPVILHSDCYINWHDGRKVHLQHAIEITEMVAAKKLAEQSNRSKSIFLAQMSHEIRTPINAILGISEINLQSSNPLADPEEGFRKIYESGSLLLKIINDVLDFSKIEAGRLEIINKKYDIPIFINDTIQINRIRYENKPIEFTLRLDENTPLEVIGDELRIRQILNNLLSNAYKYTEAGGVGLSITSEQGKDDDTVVLVYKVSDTGQGMRQDQLDRLFDEYERFNMDKNHSISGTGLGMSITRRLIELMNGEIFVESEAGKGSVFTVRIPQKKGSTFVCGAEIAESLQNFNFRSTTLMKNEQIVHEYMPNNKVLVVDDVESNLYVAKGLLFPYGLQIDTAGDGFEAIEKIKANGSYDIIFMDHMMPKMNGLEAVKIIREMGYTSPIIALTANVISGQEEMFLSNGFSGFVAKPIDSRELDLLLAHFIRDKEPLKIVEEARREQYGKEISEVKKYFVLDAENAVSELNKIISNLPELSNEEIELYIITVHGMKSALANINENTLSGIAFKLEQAGQNRNISVITNKTPAFINALRTLIEKYKSAETNNAAEISPDDMIFLHEKLNDIITAGETFEVRAVKSALAELNQKTWPRELNDMIKEVSLNLLRGDFKKVISVSQMILKV